jgi:glycosyltransferase involved in cell wall biosynthesis
MRLLSRAYDVTALCFFRNATRPTSADVAAGVNGLSAFADARAFPIPQEHRRARLLWDHLRSVVSATVYTRFAYASREYRTEIDRLMAETRFDIVHMDSLDLSEYLPALRDLPVVCTHHNVESDLLRRRAQSETSLVLRRYLELQARLMEAEEARWCGSMALNIAVSEADAKRLQEIAPDARFAVVPNGVDTEKFLPGEGEGNGVVFVGGYSWYPNRDAMEYFSEAILPVIRQGNPGLTVTWVGRAPEAVGREYERKHRISLTGYVDDIRPHVQDPACYIVPLRVGGGSRLKILDAWAMGKAVVSTSVGCEGLDARDGENILIRDTPEGFAQAVRSVIEDGELRRHIGRDARRTAETEYEWEVLGTRMLEEYARVGEKRRTSVRSIPL